MSRKKKNNKKSPRKNVNNRVEPDKFTDDPFDTSLPMRGESLLDVEVLPDQIEEVSKLHPDVIQDNESMRLAESEQVEYYLTIIGNKPDRISKLVGITRQRAEKLIKDVINIKWGINGRTTAEERLQYKKLQQARLDYLIETGFKYIEEGYKGKKLSPNEWRIVAGEIRQASNDKARLHGIGNTIIFEQFNQQTNINYTPAQHSIERDKDKRFLLEELTKVLTQKDEDGIIDLEVLDD